MKSYPAPSPAPACGRMTAAVVSAPTPRSVGVKLPWPKLGNTASPTMRSRCWWPLNRDRDHVPDVQPELAQGGRAEDDFAAGAGRAALEQRG